MKNISIKALIIAGGKGDRLKSIAKDIPKPLLSIAGIPIIERQIELLKKYNFTDIYILIGYLGEQIKDYFRQGRKFGVDIKYYQENIPLGTSGCVKCLEHELNNDHFIVIYGDLVIDMNLDNLVEFHITNHGDATIVVHPNNHPYDSDIVEMDECNRITAFYLKGSKPEIYSNLVNAAVYVLNPIVFDYIPNNGASDFVKDVFSKMLKDNRVIKGYKTVEYIKDVGTIDRFNKVELDILNGKVFGCDTQKTHPAIFLDRDGTLVKYINLLHKIEDLELYPYAASAVKTINDSDYLVFLVTNQPVVARNLCDIATVIKINKKLETLLGAEGAYLNDIYFCPHHPDSGYPEENPDYKIICDCRKPRDGMIQMAERQYNIDLSSSWFIGDSTTDIKTGIDCGMKTILLHTGIGGKDRRYDVTPDYQFNNLSEATDFIIHSSREYQELSNRFYDMIKGQNRISVITIGGLSRSGKSTFAKFLCDDLTTKGGATTAKGGATTAKSVNTKVIKLDNWLLSKADRTDSMTVRERYRYDDIKRDLSLLLGGQEISMNVYDPYNQNISHTEPFSLKGRDCIIIEGVLGLDIEYLVELSDIKVYVSLDEEKRRERFYEFYRWKDMSDIDIELLYNKRIFDESEIVKASEKNATITIHNH